MFNIIIMCNKFQKLKIILIKPKDESSKIFNESAF